MSDLTAKASQDVPTMTSIPTADLRRIETEIDRLAGVIVDIARLYRAARGASPEIRAARFDELATILSRALTPEERAELDGIDPETLMILSNWEPEAKREIA